MDRTDNVFWLVEWENEEDPETHYKRFYREAGYSYTDVTVYADAVFEFNPVVTLSITVFDGGSVLCKQSVID